MKKIKKMMMILTLTLTLTACNLPGLGASTKSNDIVIAGGNTTERQILAEISLQMVTHYLPEVKTDIINNLGSTLLVLQSLTGKDSNISGAMYTGTSLTGELGQEPLKDPELALEKVVKGYYDKYDMIWFPSYGFENSYAFMVREDFAQEHNITTVSDLENLSPSLRAGVDTAWMNRQGDGYVDFKQLYGFDFKDVLPMEIGLVYDAVASKEMDIVLGYSTDGRIQANKLRVLVDDKQLFPPYDASPVLTKDLIQTYPELEQIFLKLSGEIDSDTMQKLNRRSDEMKIEPQVIATEFLEEHQYFENKPEENLADLKNYTEIAKDLKGEQ
ncbi:osmoprotectant ABC transporter substrate-binding protein [Erysipelothrix urinaevulpis]|uniref:osmoprotectant ABC transporter substrate-binding protein n=1 Tax=Erysipelothrix urinaevulpis TaxID=2683717 RepID=UPI0019159D0B|nr:osmoprotectant ABC transporter substrate-binding protein [Erysipelothrix urinaevulpis]